MSTDTREVLAAAKSALGQLIEAGKAVKAALDATIHDGEPVHPESRRLTWPISSGLLALDAVDAALATQPAQPTVATVTECEACFTPDVCQLRGTCDHYSAQKLRVATQPAQPSAPIDAFELYAELRDLVAEAGAVDTLIGRPEVLRSRLADLCKRVGQLTTDLPLGTAQPSATCEWTNCPRRVGDVCCNEKAAQPSAPPAAYTVSGKPLVWSHTYDDQWLDEDYGFSIMLERDSETPYYAAWGEGDSEDFATLEEAKAWCQAEIDRWVRRSVVVTPAQPSAQGEAVAWLVEWKAHGYGPQWWGFNHTPGKSATWCSDANNAIRFARKEDAERMRLHIIAVAGLTGMHEYERSVSVTEHLWEVPCRAE